MIRYNTVKYGVVLQHYTVFNHIIPYYTVLCSKLSVRTRVLHKYVASNRNLLLFFSWRRNGLGLATDVAIGYPWLSWAVLLWRSWRRQDFLEAWKSWSAYEIQIGDTYVSPISLGYAKRVVKLTTFAPILSSPTKCFGRTSDNSAGCVNRSLAKEMDGSRRPGSRI